MEDGDRMGRKVGIGECPPGKGEFGEFEQEAQVGALENRG